MKDKFGVFNNPDEAFNNSDNLSLDKDCLNAAKDEIKKTYGNLKFLPEFLKDTICSFYYHKYFNMGTSDNPMPEGLFTIEINQICNNMLPDLLPDYKKLKMELDEYDFQLQCKVMKMWLLYGFSIKMPYLEMKIKSIFKSPCIKNIDSISTKMGL